MVSIARITLGERLARVLYCVAWWLVTPALLLWFAVRGLRQRGYLAALGERFGRCPVSEPGTRLVWVHAVSVGETRAAEPLIRAMLDRWPDIRILLTHMTPTGRETGAGAFADLVAAGRLRQAWLPWDYPGATRRMLSRARPVLGLIMETELWPNLVASARSASVPVVLANARLSERSLRKGLRWRALIGPALRSLDQVLAQTQSDAKRLGQLGREAVPAIGNLKFDIDAPAQMLARGALWRERLLSREPLRGVVLAASTRDGEEAMLLAAWRALGEPAPDSGRPLLVLVPRHPQRFDAVAQLAREQGWQVKRRSAFEGDGPELAHADLVIGDSMGEMFAWYALADVAIIGGSLAPLGGQNLIEACAVGCPVVLGPHTFNFEEISQDAVAAGAALRVADAAGALGESLRLLGEPARRQAMSVAALAFAAQHRGATVRTLDAIAPVIEARTGFRSAASHAPRKA
jgi:3-deoxy-D-manno-octulosonic-acid transferase